MEELKPCPFCGRPGQITKRRIGPLLYFKPRCSKLVCIARKGNVWFPSKKEAIEVWNRRAKHDE